MRSYSRRELDNVLEVSENEEFKSTIVMLKIMETANRSLDSLALVVLFVSQPSSLSISLRMHMYTQTHVRRQLRMLAPACSGRCRSWSRCWRTYAPDLMSLLLFLVPCQVMAVETGDQMQGGEEEPASRNM